MDGSQSLMCPKAFLFCFYWTEDISMVHSIHNATKMVTVYSEDCRFEPCFSYEKNWSHLRLLWGFHCEKRVVCSFFPFGFYFHKPVLKQSGLVKGFFVMLLLHFIILLPALVGSTVYYSPYCWTIQEKLCHSPWRAI